MKPTILVIYYSQSGQLRHILERLVVDIVTECDIEFLPIQPVRDFPFPWNAYDFFDAMPECVQQIPEEIYPLKPKRTSYDCVLFLCFNLNYTYTGLDEYIFNLLGTLLPIPTSEDYIYLLIFSFSFYKVNKVLL